jgi:hypothetical protein
MFFELYERYRIAAMVLAKAAELCGIKRPTVLELGSDGNNYLGEFFRDAQVTPLNLYSDNLETRPENFIEADAADMWMLEAGSFDFVISLAVFEHVPENKRRRFLSESLRVAKIGAFHAAPFEAEYILAAERRVSDDHKRLFGEKHPWIEEHMEIGHPNLCETEEALMEMDCNYTVFKHMDVDVWESCYKLFMSLQTWNIYLLCRVNDFYAERVFARDIGNQNVFSHIYMAKTGCKPEEIHDFLENNFEKMKDKEDILRQLADTYCRFDRIHDFFEGIMKEQSCIYLYGVTSNLILWMNTVLNSPQFTITVLDAYMSGDVGDLGAMMRSEIEKPNPEELKRKTVIVFPDLRYPEIFEYLKSVDAKPVFYKDVADVAD